MKIVNYILLLVAFVIVGCEEMPTEKVNTLPSMHPYYVDITIPANIAPLNFIMNDSAQGIDVYIDGVLFDRSGSNKMEFNVGKWREMMTSKKGTTVSVVVEATYGDKKRRYNPFTWTIADSIDSYITYRLLAPGSEVPQDTSFSPSGRYITFSENTTIPVYHSDANKRIDFFDVKSDVYVTDVKSGKRVAAPQLADSILLETSPSFSSDGKYIYFCRATKTEKVKDTQYDLCRVSFDEKTGIVGDSIETVVKAVKGQKSSICYPRVSPDGNYLLYTVADYGTSPIWHQESDLRMMDLRTGEIDSLQDVNSDRSDTYHCWSSNGRWFVFASKRDDGIYNKLYFCYVDTAGKVYKPFVLPQENPLYYDYTLKSFNVPELGKGKVPFDAQSVRKLIDN